jgi:hypothetical protein
LCCHQNIEKGSEAHKVAVADRNRTNLEAAQKAHAAALVDKARLLRMGAHKAIFHKQVMKIRSEKHEQQLADYTKAKAAREAEERKLEVQISLSGSNTHR